MADLDGDGLDDVTHLPVPPKGGDDSTYGPNNKNAGQPGYDINGRPLSSNGLPEGFVIGRNGELIPPGKGATAGAGIPPGTRFRLGDRVYWWNGKTITAASVADTKSYDGAYDLDPASETGFADNGTAGSTTGGTGGASAGSSTRLASDDPRYWDLQYQKLYQDGLNIGLDAETARRQALTSLIQSRNNLSSDVANTSASVAKTLAEFAANPRDAYAEAYYANQVGNTMPFADIANQHFGEYGKTLAEKADRIFQPVGADLAQARLYRDAIPMPDYLAPSPQVQGLLSSGAPAPAAAPEANGLQMLMDRLNGMSEADKSAFRKWTTGDVATAAKGGTFDFEGAFADRDKPGASPSSSEGGTNMNLHERAIIVGESGRVYATLGEKRPDGTIRSEQLQIKPLKSEVEKDKKLQEGNKAIVESQKKTLASFATGGDVAATPDDLYGEFQKMLQRLTGEHGGGGTSTPFGGTRHVAGSLANEALINPMVRSQLESTYSAMGISPEQLWADVERFSPKSAQRNGQLNPRVNFL